MAVPARIDLTGQRFGRLLVLSYAGLRKGKAYWDCACDCGALSAVSGGSLRKGATTSCGCYRAEFMSKSKRKHGMSHTPEWTAYYRMLSRCYNPKTARFPQYGGRGIKVCDRWRDSFENFYSDMGARPKGHSLDRIDVNGDYMPENCRWATAVQQAQNKTTNINLAHGGQVKCLTEWAREFKVPVLTAYSRLRRGLPFEQVFARKEP